MKNAARLSLLCLTLAIGGASVYSSDESLPARIAAATQKLSIESGESVTGGAEIINIGAPAAPALVKLLADESFKPKWHAIALLGRVGGREHLPLLKKFADAAPDAAYVSRDLNGGGAAALAAWAHLAIVRIICPESEHWPGNYGSTDPNDPCILAYKGRVEDAYRKWAATYPATSASASAPASRAALSHDYYELWVVTNGVVSTGVQLSAPNMAPDKHYMTLTASNEASGTLTISGEAAFVEGYSPLPMEFKDGVPEAGGLQSAYKLVQRTKLKFAALPKVTHQITTDFGKKTAVGDPAK
jgi:hypothetical protein